MKEYKYIVVSGCSFTAGHCMYNDKEGNLIKDFIPTPMEELPPEYISTPEQILSLKEEVSLLSKNITYRQTTNRYSRKLADKLNCEEINISQGGSSNDRIFRTLFNWIESNEEKVKDCLFVIGLTDNIRKDLWSNYKNDYIISSEIWHDIKYIARDLNTTEDEVNQWRDFELKYLLNEDEIEKDLIRKCVLFDSYVGGNMVFLNAWRRSEVVHPNLKFLKLKSEKYEGYNWSDYIASYTPDWYYEHPREFHHHEMADILYEFINKTFGGDEH